MEASFSGSGSIHVVVRVRRPPLLFLCKGCLLLELLSGFLIASPSGTARSRAPEAMAERGSIPRILQTRADNSETGIEEIST